MVLQPAAPTSPGNLLEMQVFGTHSTTTETETLGVGPDISVLTNLPGDSVGANI